MHILIWLCCFALLPFFVFLSSILLGAAWGLRRGPSPIRAFVGSYLPKMIVLVPAHDEESIISRTVQSLHEHDYPQDLFCVVVVADNCTDLTAKLAREAGAMVFERRDPERRGKGYALEFALEKIEKMDFPWEAVVIVDADTQVESGALRSFAANIVKGIDWQQGYYTVFNPEISWRTQLLTLALSLFNGVWAQGSDIIGLGSPLRGNGMAFSRCGLRRRGLKAFGLAEDLEFSWGLRLAGEHVHFVRDAIVRGIMVSRGGSMASNQRLRWEYGRQTLRRLFRRQIWTTAQRPFLWRLMASLDIYFPALARLSLWLMLTSIGAYATSNSSALILSAVYAGVLGLYLISPLFLMRLPVRYLKALLFAPAYMLWKLGLTLAPKPQHWVRTARE